MQNTDIYKKFDLYSLQIAIIKKKVVEIRRENIKETNLGFEE